MHTFTYLKTFIRDKNVASITPTSSIGVRKVCSKIDFSNGNVIVEYGPGTGVFTNYILKNMSSNSRLILIERNKDFGSILRKTFHDPRIKIINGSAENVLENCRECQADYIVSGIPFFWLPIEMKNRILTNTYKALKEGGKFLVYQTCFQTNNHLKVHLEHYFRYVESRYEIRNIPPLRIYEAVK